MNEMTAVSAPPSLVAKMAAQYGVEPTKMLATLKATAFKGEAEVSNEQMMALLIVANEYGLNPWTKEIYAFPDKQRGIVPVVGVDGWTRIINSHPMFDGLEFVEDEAGAWCECTIYRKDRAHPIKVREYLSECKRNTGPWGSHPRRMLRHKTLIQCGRVAFSFGGIYDPDEAERIIEGERVDALPITERGVNAFMVATDPERTVVEPEVPRDSADISDLYPPEPPMPPTIAEVSAMIQKGEYDAAADLARSFPAAERKVLEMQIAAAVKKAGA